MDRGGSQANPNILMRLMSAPPRFPWRLQVEAVQFGLKRLERLLEAGHQREAERLLAIVKRDSAA